MTDWKQYKIRDIIHLEYGKSLRDYHDGLGNYNVFGTNGKIGTSNFYLFSEPSVIIGRKGAYREVHLAKTPSFVIDTAFYTKNKIKNLDTTFLFYWFKNIDINQMDSGSAIPSTSRDEVYDLDILLPAIEEQKVIASILCALDDKIELLTKQNITLESFAETLFQYWFEENPNKAWKTKPLSSVADFLNGLACQKYPPKNDIDKLPVLKIKELSNGISENSDWVTSDISFEYLVRNGDIIFAWSATLMVKIWNGKDCVLNQHLFKVTSSLYPKWFYYLWCKYHLEDFMAIAASHATTMGHIKRADLDNALVLVPTVEELKIMSKQITPLIDKVIANNSQVETLKELRDTLLPKLINGELRVNLL